MPDEYVIINKKSLTALADEVRQQNNINEDLSFSQIVQFSSGGKYEDLTGEIEITSYLRQSTGTLIYYVISRPNGEPLNLYACRMQFGNKRRWTEDEEDRNWSVYTTFSASNDIRDAWTSKRPAYAYFPHGLFANNTVGEEYSVLGTVNWIICEKSHGMFWSYSSQDVGSFAQQVVANKAFVEDEEEEGLIRYIYLWFYPDEPQPFEEFPFAMDLWGVKAYEN